MFRASSPCVTTTRRCYKEFLRQTSRASCPSDSARRQGHNINVNAMPSPRGLPIIGTTLSLIAAGSAPKMHEYVDSRHRQLGPVYREKIGPLQAVFVANADDMRSVFALEGKYPAHFIPDAWVLYNKMYDCKRGILFMDGEEWLATRRVMNELLLKADSGRFLVGPCAQAADDLVERWRKRSGPEVANLESEMYIWATNVVMAVAMGSLTYAERKQHFAKVVEELANKTNTIFEKSVTLSVFPAKLAASLNLPMWKSFVSVTKDALSSVNELVHHLMPECKGTEGLLGRMMEGGMSDEYVLRIVSDMLLAAGDTSAFTMQWILYTLGKNPDIQEELYKELCTLNNPEEIVQSTYLKNYVREVLRLYPVAPFILRYLPKESVIGGYPVPAGHLIILSIYTSGRDEKYFSDPNRFWPQRWSRDASGHFIGVKSSFASLPFAMGARSCVGRKIADAELMITTAKLIQQFKIELIDPSPVKMVLRLVGVPSKPIRLWLTDR